MNGYAPIHNGELYYEVDGQGHPLVLIHAGVADHTMWDAHAPVLASRFRVIRYDTRGYGKSRTQDTPFSNRQDLLDLLDHLQVPAAHLIGISRGGQIALDFTLEHPDRVTALVLVASGMSGWDFPAGQEDPAEAAAFEALEAAEQAGDWERLADLETAMWADGPGQSASRIAPELRRRVWRWIYQNNTRTDGKAEPVPLDPPAAGRLGEVRVPTLILWGDLDTKAILLIAPALANGIAGARQVLFPGIAHMLPLEIPDEFNAAVLSFLP